MQSILSSFALGKSLATSVDFDFRRAHGATSSSIDHLLQAVESGIENSFKNQSFGDGPIGVLLSGGLDSALVLAYVKKFYPTRDIFTYTLGYTSQDSHLAFARKVSETFGATHREIIFPIASELFAILTEIGATQYHFEFEDSLIMNHILAKEVKKDCAVVFSGFGLDYVFGGMDLFRNAYIEKLYNTGLVDIKYVLDSVGGNKYYCKYLLEKFTDTKLTADYFIKYGEYYGDLLNDAKEKEVMLEFQSMVDSFPQESTDLSTQIYYVVSTSLAKRYAPYNEPYALQGVTHIAPFGDMSFIQEILHMDILGEFLYNPYTQEKKYIIQRIGDRMIPESIRRDLHKGTVLSYHQAFLQNKSAIIDEVHSHKATLGTYIRDSVFLELPELIQESIWFENSKKVLILLQLIFWFKQ